MNDEEGSYEYTEYTLMDCWYVMVLQVGELRRELITPHHKRK
jgi:hypothetical protein